jgi:hypothetical protein
MAKKLSEKPIIFQAKNGAIELRGDVKKETLWATQAQIANLFETERSVVTKHIKNIFKDSELDQEVVCAKIAHTTYHGAIENKTQTREVFVYNLDIILAIGYRTNSAKAIEFRKWSTKILKDYLVKGYSINKKVVQKNYEEFLKSVNEIKTLLPAGNFSDTKNVFT